MNNFDLIFQRYRESLLEIKDFVTQTIDMSNDGELTEEEAIPFLNECEKEIQEIEDCIHTLHYIWNKRR